MKISKGLIPKRKRNAPDKGRSDIDERRKKRKAEKEAKLGEDGKPFSKKEKYGPLHHLTGRSTHNTHTGHGTTQANPTARPAHTTQLRQNTETLSSHNTDTSCRTEDLDAPVSEQDSVHKFATKIEPGESFASYCKRIGQEKRIALLSQAGGKMKKTSDKRKQFLKDKKKKKKKGGGGNGSDGDEEQGGRGGKAKVFEAEKIKFGDIADRPPELTVKPKKKERVNVTNIARIGEDEDEDSDEEADRQESAEAAVAKKQAEARMLAMLRDKAQAAYKQSKQRRREQDKQKQLANSGNKSAKKAFKGYQGMMM